MALIKYFVGNVASGKSAGMYDYLLKTSDISSNRSKKLIIIVPEQYSIKAQSSLLKVSNKKAILSPQIYSFKRLAGEILDKNGVGSLKKMDDTAKIILLRRLSYSLKGDDSFQIDLKKSGNIEAVKAVISEFEQYAVNDDDITVVLDSLDENMPDYKRLGYIQKIYKEYRTFCFENDLCFDILLKAIDIIEEIQFFKDAVIAFDEFNGFTLSQLNMIRALNKQASELIFTLTVPDIDILKSGFINDDNDSRLFYPAIRTYGTLKKYFVIDGKYNEEFSVFDKSSLSKHQELIRTYFLRNGKAPVKSKNDNVFLINESGIEDELKVVCAEIRNLVVNYGYSYKDIAIVTPDIQTYERLVFELNKKYDLPLSTDSSGTVLENVLPVFLLNCLDVVINGFTAFSVIKFMKNPIAMFDCYYAEALENKALRLNINSKSYFLSMIDKDENIKRLFDILDPLNRLYESKNTTAGQITSAIRDILSCDFIKEGAKRHLEVLKLDKDLYIDEINTSFDSIMNLLDTIEFLLDTSFLTIEEFKEILVSGLKSLKIARAPQRLDCVVIKDMLRSKHRGEYRAVFLLGMNDTVLPMLKGGNGLFSPTLRQSFYDNDIILSDNEEQDILVQSFELYRSLIMAKDRLYLSYPLSNELNEELKPGYFLSILAQIFDFNSLDTRLLKLVFNNELSDDNKKYIEYFDIKALIDKDISVALYKKDKSISELESFAACPFSHFLKYGLKLMKRELYKPSSIDYGNLLHLSMKNIQTSLIKEGKSFRELNSSDIGTYLTAAIDSALNENRLTAIKNNELEDNKNRIRKIINTTLLLQKYQEEQGGFRLFACEHKFNLKLKNTDIFGIIDRIDVSDDKIRIIDYKSSAHDLDLTKLYYGLQMQLPIYAKGAICELEKNYGLKLSPGGIFYYQMADPIIDLSDGKKNIDNNLIDEKLKDSLRLSGIFDASIDTLRMIDKNMIDESSDKPAFAGGMKSSVVHLTTKKDGNFSAVSRVFSRNDMESIIDHSVNMAEELNNRIEGGNISIYPVRYNKFDACAYCSYSNICKIDDKKKYRYLNDVGIYSFIKEM